MFPLQSEITLTLTDQSKVLKTLHCTRQSLNCLTVGKILTHVLKAKYLKYENV